MFGEKYIIGLIDESEEDIKTIKGYFFTHGNRDTIELVYISPEKKTMNDIIEEIYLKKVDFLLIDLKLMDGSEHCSFNGDEIIKAINNINPELPKIILTNNPNDSIKGAIENAVISKSYLTTDNLLFVSIINSIDNYRKKVIDTDKKIEKLRLKLQSGERLTPKQEKDLYFLEDMMVKYIGRTKISESVLKRVNEEKLEKLIEQANKILEINI